jgi:amino acid permease
MGESPAIVMAMLGQLSPFVNAIALICAAMAIGASWVATIASPNCSFDKLDGSRADRHVRELLYQTAIPIAGMMLAAAALFVLAGSYIAGATAAIAAFGFYSTRMMLAPKQGRNPRGVRTQRKDQRGTSVILSLMFTIVAIISALLGAFGV